VQSEYTEFTWECEASTGPPEMTLANQLTLLRICLVPALVILVVYGWFGWAAAVFFVAAVTDGLDGLVARWRHERTALGAILDPLADKLLTTALLIVLALPSPELTVRIPPWIAILSIGRDAGILLAVLVFHLAGAKGTIPPSSLGKATTVVHLGTLLWVLLCNYRGQDHPLTMVLLWAMLALVLISGVHYLYLGQRIVAQETKKEAAS
jgi:cardiolipin synthase